MASRTTLRNDSNYSNDDLDYKVYGYLLNNPDEIILGRSDLPFVGRNFITFIPRVLFFSILFCYSRIENSAPLDMGRWDSIQRKDLKDIAEKWKLSQKMILTSLFTWPLLSATKLVWLMLLEKPIVLDRVSDYYKKNLINLICYNLYILSKHMLKNIKICSSSLYFFAFNTIYVQYDVLVWVLICAEVHRFT